jgi:hypothetical protein
LFSGGPSNQLLVFDDFTKYNAGYTINRAASIRVKVDDQIPSSGLCSWFLTVAIENGSGILLNDNWEELNTYGNTNSQEPKISLLQIRIRNGCQTSPSDGIWQNFTSGINNPSINIIPEIINVTALDIISAGSCTQNVNGPGSYLANYNEYNFDIDIRINPLFDYNPGIYQLNLKFHLEENTP